MDWNEFIKNTVALMIVLDPVGVAPLVQSLLLPVPRKRRQRVLRRELVIVLFLLLLFFFMGENILGYMGIDDSTLSLSGGIMLMLIAIGMVFPRVNVISGDSQHDSQNSEPLVVPIAVPIIVGPASLTTVMILAAKCHSSATLAQNGLSIVVAWSVAAVILMCSRKMLAKLGNRGSVALTRLMGTLLVLLAVQMMVNGFTSFARDFMKGEPALNPAAVQNMAPADPEEQQAAAPAAENK